MSEEHTWNDLSFACTSEFHVAVMLVLVTARAFVSTILNVKVLRQTSSVGSPNVF
jgi:hypothetical protein